MKFKKIQKLIAINLIVLIFLLVFHEKILTKLDSYIMPNAAVQCSLKSIELIEKLKNSQNEFDTFEKIQVELKDLNLEIDGKNFLYEPSYKMAIIVPYRDRYTNLKLFLRYIHPFLAKQKIYYGIYLVEPVSNLTFNKGISMNVGYVEALKDYDWDCFIFHDVDLLPENDKNIYGCDRYYPKLISIAISAFGYSTDGYFKEKYFGGVTAFTKEQFKKINGFSNCYYGWGLEDDDVRQRVLTKFPKIRRSSPDIGRYYANCHQIQKRNPSRFIIYMNAVSRQHTDGLNSLKYKLIKTESNYLFKRLFISYPGE